MELAIAIRDHKAQVVGLLRDPNTGRVGTFASRKVAASVADYLRVQGLLAALVPPPAHQPTAAVTATEAVIGARDLLWSVASRGGSV